MSNWRTVDARFDKLCAILDAEGRSYPYAAAYGMIRAAAAEATIYGLSLEQFLDLFLPPADSPY